MIAHPNLPWSGALRVDLLPLIRRWPRPFLHGSVTAIVLLSVMGGVLTTRRATSDASGRSQAMAPVVPAVATSGVAGARKVEAGLDVAPSDNGLFAPLTADDGLPVPLKTYAVQDGDNVRSIAKQFGVSNETLIWVNDLDDPDMLHPGQKLKILPFSGLIHEVRPGDTVAAIANNYDAKVDDVIRTNRLAEPYVILVGQKLVVPGGYRPLPQKILPVARPPSATTTDADSVQAPADEDGQQAAAVKTPAPAKRKLPQLGNTPQEQFIGSIAEAAIESHEATGVPASVTIAQAILESYWGSSRLSTEAHNYFGIKAQPKPGPAGVVSFDVWEVVGGRNVVQTQGFRAYHNAAESFVDHGKFFLENGRYAAAMAARRDSKQFAREISRAGYATDPAYASKLIALMDRYNLYRYDE